MEVLSFCLKQSGRIERQPEDDEAVTKIVNQVAASLTRSSSEELSQETASSGGALDILRILVCDFGAFIDDATLVIVTAYTDSRVAWSNEHMASNARTILDRTLAQDRKRLFITSVVLDRYIRPVFSRESSSRITQTGRVAHYTNGTPHRGSQDILAADTIRKPWKHERNHAVAVFTWAVGESNESLIGKHWPLFTPVLLALVEDTDSKFKAKGLKILKDFLARCPASVLQDTGLGEIFEQLIFPILLSLPRLTPENESLELLEPAYDAAIGLAAAQFPDDRSRHQKNRFLTRLLRQGPIAGHYHASEYPKIMEILSRQASLILQQLGTCAIPHLREMLPILTAILHDPFFASCPTCVEATSRALSAMLLNCWPVMSQPTHLAELLSAISVCWLNLRVEQGGVPENAASRKAVEAVADLVPLLTSIAASAEISLQGQLSSLCAAEPRLVDLFRGPRDDKHCLSWRA
ncbi:poly polymerase protein [Colletotrichum plurivorum]|uniref:Poly polymerase protein n=1 Tax=Colletotrichum plurivorum TaxID=2175906 RepID=A0A8H6J8W7_9PEZI|nr:poly polymerase protein [Colletotrichum plurivorum]